MYYRLNDSVGLRKWKGVERAYYVKGSILASGLSKEEWDVALACDGEHDLDVTPVLERLIEKRLVLPCKKGDGLSEYSKLREYDNRYFPKMNLMITGKCNYNCRHCFNAKDNAPLNSEWKYEDILNLLDQAQAMGIHAFTITGGEPMVHPRFFDILAEIYRRDMSVFELNTNGFFINDEILEKMKGIGCYPLIKISFDGIGFHDWMRQHKGAEENAYHAIELCKKHGFRVKVQTQVHLHNLHTMLPTCLKMAELGCDEVRIIRTTEVVRWTENNEGSVLPMDRFYDELAKFAKEYMDTGTDMFVDIWQYMTLRPYSRAYSFTPVMSGGQEFKLGFPRCRGNRGMIAITSDGEVVPCLQMSGYFAEFNIHLGNVKKTPLKEIMGNEDVFQYIGGNLLDYMIRNETCGNCAYFKVCAGGCPALGLLTSGDSHDYYHEDLSKCLFFKKGYYDKVKDILKDYTLLNPIVFNEEDGLYDQK